MTDNSRLTRSDLLFIAFCVTAVLVSSAVVGCYFSTAFPEAVIDFRYDRGSSRQVAERIAVASGLPLPAMHHAARFDSDHLARIFLERSLGLEETNRVLAKDVRVWFWHHRWFRPLEKEEVSVDVAPTGEIVGYRHQIAEERELPQPRIPPVAIANSFLDGIGVNRAGLQLVEESQRQLPRRTQRIFTWESKSVRPAGAPYRYTVAVDGGVVTSYDQRLKVPDAWIRSYRELRSKNGAAGAVDGIVMAVTALAAIIIFVVRLRRGDLSIRFLMAIGIASIVLVGGVAINSIPSQLASYDTTASYGAFFAQIVLMSIVQSIGIAMMLIVICGAGEVLYRQRLPQQLAIPRIWTPRALRSRKVFLGLILGYALVPLFIAYQVVFYLVAQRFGAWAPAEVPYDDILNSALPWFAVLFAGFFPAFSEEFLSRAFSIPFYQRIVRSRITAIVLAGLVWGFGHAGYPNQPFWIRGVEVGIAGIVAGLLMDRFGLLPLLIWHYTIDAVYTAALLFTSHNTYYIVTAAFASLVFALPMFAAIALYVRHRGFLPDDDLTNAAMPLSSPMPEEADEKTTPLLPPPVHVSRRVAILCAMAIVFAVVAWMVQPESPQDAIEYRITASQAKDLARSHVGATTHRYVIAAPVEGFRSWDPGSPREDGGAPGGFDDIAATYLARRGMPVPKLIEIFRGSIEAGTWVIRFFTPMVKEEILVEIDPRDSRVVGYHKYQDERAAGASLAQPQALALARQSFDVYGLDIGHFDVRETLTFVQPNRRDWLFHFQERSPLAGEAFRRVSVRVAGAEVTQFNKTVWIPEGVRREAETQTVLNVVLFAVKIVGVLVLVALVVSGLVIASRAHRLPWRRALRWTLVLSIIPIASFASRYETMLFGYSTSVAWDAYRVNLITIFLRDVGLQAGLLFLAIAGLEAAFPYAPDVWRREGRARFGRAAVLSSVTALAILTIVDVASRWLAHLWPFTASVQLAAPSEVAIPLPGVILAGQALIGAIGFSAAVALYAFALRRWVAVITIAAIFCAMVDPLAGGAEAAVMLIRAAVVAALLWLLGRNMLGANPLAWPLAAFLGASLPAAFAMLENGRPDLTANGLLLVAVAMVVLWSCLARPHENQGRHEPGC